MTLQETFINNLKHYRKDAGLTQAQLATYIDKSFNYINGIECGVFFPPPEVIEKISEILKIKPVQLFSESNCKENIINSGKEEFISNLSELIYSKIKGDIQKDIYKGIKDILG